MGTYLPMRVQRQRALQCLDQQASPAFSTVCCNPPCYYGPGRIELPKVLNHDDQNHDSSADLHRVERIAAAVSRMLPQSNAASTSAVTSVRPTTDLEQGPFRHARTACLQQFTVLEPIGSTSTLDTKDTSYGFYGGYRWFANFAIEGGYMDLGKYVYRIDSVGVDTRPTNPSPNWGQKLTADVAGISVSALGILPRTIGPRCSRAAVSSSLPVRSRVRLPMESIRP